MADDKKQAPAKQPTEGAAAGAKGGKEQQGVKPISSASTYRYTGPQGPKVAVPGLNVSFNPGEISDERITELIERHPTLARLWEKN